MKWHRRCLRVGWLPASVSGQSRGSTGRKINMALTSQDGNVAWTTDEISPCLLLVILRLELIYLHEAIEPAMADAVRACARATVRVRT